jgi:hypothetical protein
MRSMRPRRSSRGRAARGRRWKRVDGRNMRRTPERARPA